MRPGGGSIGGPPHPRFPSQTAPVGAARHDSRYGGGPAPYDTHMRHPAGRGGYPGGGPPPHAMGGMGMPAYGAPPGGPGARFCVIKLKGLPFGVKDYEIGLFLGVEPLDVVIGMRNGRPSGEAYAVLTHPAEMDIALRKNKAYMGTRYVEVYEAKKMDYYRAIIDVYSDGRMVRASSQQQKRGGRSRSRSPVSRRGSRQQKDTPVEPATTPIVKLRGLPFSAGPERVLEFFDDPSLEIPSLPPLDKVLIATGPDKRPTGMAFVEFESIDTANKALKKHKQSMGNRYIEIFPATEDDRARFLPVEHS
ncbi:hypothetical protein M9434_004339 [Picochlorum sp. BPE23]|nr:hypothetical protein M9434_004339 [Picochlorum sp. BPE23]